MRFDGFCVWVRICTTRDTATPDFLAVLLSALDYEEEAVGWHGTVGVPHRRRSAGTKSGAEQTRRLLLTTHVINEMVHGCCSATTCR